MRSPLLTLLTTYTVTRTVKGMCVWASSVSSNYLLVFVARIMWELVPEKIIKIIEDMFQSLRSLQFYALPVYSLWPLQYMPSIHSVNYKMMNDNNNFLESFLILFYALHTNQIWYVFFSFIPTRIYFFCHHILMGCKTVHKAHISLWFRAEK